MTWYIRRYLPCRVGLLSHPVEPLSCHVWLYYLQGEYIAIYRETFTMSIWSICHALRAFIYLKRLLPCLGTILPYPLVLLPVQWDLHHVQGKLFRTISMYILFMIFHLICICHNIHAQARLKDSLYTYNT